MSARTLSLMGGGPNVPGGGAELRLATTGWMLPVVGVVTMVLGVCVGVAAHRAGDAAQQPLVLTLLGAGFTGFGAWLAARRTSVVLDRDAMTATVRWRWLFLRGEETVSARGKSVVVERTVHRSKDGDSETFAVVLDGVRLRKVAEMEGGAERAVATAEQVASHLGIPYAGRRDCASTRRAAQRRKELARSAMVPLLVVFASMLLVFVYMTLIAPVG